MIASIRASGKFASDVSMARRSIMQQAVDRASATAAECAEMETVFQRGA
jgi:hypothetical protein